MRSSSRSTSRHVGGIPLSRLYRSTSPFIPPRRRRPGIRHPSTRETGHGMSSLSWILALMLAIESDGLTSSRNVVDSSADASEHRLSPTRAQSEGFTSSRNVSTRTRWTESRSAMRCRRSRDNGKDMCAFGHEGSEPSMRQPGASSSAKSSQCILPAKALSPARRREQGARPSDQRQHTWRRSSCSHWKLPSGGECSMYS
mmetsp:Transcript_24556/g.72865  ORF Transcript_24556/g.72865 Transcript_24556/m.72865 type:complete len:200 (-) Transcript_24556:790-1389(-)